MPMHCSPAPSIASPLIAAILLIASAATPLLAQSIEERLPTCFACHGEKGSSATPETPSLGALPAFYATVQLLMFRDSLRVAPPMNDMAKGLSDADLTRLGEIIAKLPAPVPAGGPIDQARAERARALIQRAKCSTCHRPNFFGQENVPRLAGQREDYLLKSLRGYKSNSRHGYDDQMADVVGGLADADFVDLAYYLARQN
jgi:cytochrome c553